MVLEELNGVDWDSFPQPSGNAPGHVAASLRRLAEVPDEASMWAAYHQVLYAFGNNHAGTYYPVALAAIQFLAEIVAQGGAWARLGALEVLVDLVGAFEPEAGCELVTDLCGVARPTHMQLFMAVSAHRALLDRLVVSGDSNQHRALAHDILQVLDEVAAVRVS